MPSGCRPAIISSAARSKAPAPRNASSPTEQNPKPGSMEVTIKKIDKLTPEQEAVLPQFREDWRAIGLATAPIEAEAARRAVRGLYNAADTDKDLQAVIVLSSPMACLLARAICNKLIKPGLSNNQRQVLEKKLGDQLWDQLGGQLRDQLRGQLGDQLRGQLWDQLGGQLRGQLSGQLSDQLGDQLRDQLFQSTYFVGAADAYWLSFYEFSERIGVKYGPRTKEHFDAYKSYALTCCWLYAYKSLAFVSDRPAEIHCDGQHRLHCETGMAVRFRDGWGIHAWHGLRVPGDIIERKDFEPAIVEQQPNAELRRVLLERKYGPRTGFELYLEQRAAKLIAQDDLHGFPRRLLEVHVAEQPIRIIEVINGSLEPDGTRRKFHLGAMRGDTPAAAIAASYGIAPKHYREAVRT